MTTLKKIRGIRLWPELMRIIRETFQVLPKQTVTLFSQGGESDMETSIDNADDLKLFNYDVEQLVIEVSDLQASGKLCKVGRLAPQGGKLKIATAAGGKKALAPAAAVGSASAAKATKAGWSTPFAALKVMMAKARAKAAAGKGAKEANGAQLGEKLAKLQATPSYVVSSDRRWHR